MYNSNLGIFPPTIIARAKTFKQLFDVLIKLGWEQDGDKWISPPEIKKSVIFVDNLVLAKQDLMRLYSPEYVKFMIFLNSANETNNQISLKYFNCEGQRVNAMKNCRQIVTLKTLKILGINE